MATLLYLTFTLPRSSSPLYHSHTPPPPNLSRLQCASPHGLVNCLGKSPRGFLHFFISFPGSCKTVLSYQTTVFSSKKSNTKKAKKKGIRWIGPANVGSLSCLPIVSALHVHRMLPPPRKSNKVYIIHNQGG